MDPQLFARVPPEVWKNIFKYIEWDASSLVNCLNFQGRGSWYDVLSENATTYLLPLVLPFLREELPTRDILTLRLVCKPWKSAVSSLLEEMSSYYHVPSKAVYQYTYMPAMERFGKNFGVTTFNSSLEIENFMSQMKKYKGNSFVNTTVKILSTDAGRNSAELYQKFTNLIENCGHHILTCDYVADGTKECNKQMQYLFEHLPNLRCLTINKWPNSPRDDKERNEERESLKWLRDPDSFPPLNHLKSLNFSSDSSRICDSLLKRYGRQLHCLQIQLSDLKHSPFFNEHPIQRYGLEYLRALEIRDGFGDTSLLDRISVFQLPFLERLHLTFCSDRVNYRHAGLKSVLKIINKFSSTLVELSFPSELFSVCDTLKEHYDDETEFENDICIQLPHVKRIDIPYSYIYNGLCQTIFNRLLHKFPNLMRIHVRHFDEDYRNKILEQEELRHLADRFHSTLPSIQNITVEEQFTHIILFHSTRQQYESRQQGGADSPLILSSSDDENEYDFISESDEESVNDVLSGSDDDGEYDFLSDSDDESGYDFLSWSADENE